MTILPATLAPLEPCQVAMTRRSVDGTVTGRSRWAAKATSHAVTCDYLVGRGFRVCTCLAAQAALR